MMIPLRLHCITRKLVFLCEKPNEKNKGYLQACCYLTNKNVQYDDNRSGYIFDMKRNADDTVINLFMWFVWLSFELSEADINGWLSQLSWFCFHLSYWDIEDDSMELPCSVACTHKRGCVMSSRLSNENGSWELDFMWTGACFISHWKLTWFLDRAVVKTVQSYCRRQAALPVAATSSDPLVQAVSLLSLQNEISDYSSSDSRSLENKSMPFGQGYKHNCFAFFPKHERCFAVTWRRAVHLLSSEMKFNLCGRQLPYKSLAHGIILFFSWKTQATWFFW